MPPLLSELDGVAGEIGQYLAQPQASPSDDSRRVRGDRERRFQPLALRARGEQFDNALDEPVEIEGLGDQIEPTRLDPGEIEDLVDQTDERRAGTADRLDIAGVSGVKPGLAQQIGHAEDAAQRRADLVAHRRQEARLRLARRFGALARGGAFLQPPNLVAQRFVGRVGAARARAAARRRRWSRPSASASARDDERRGLDQQRMRRT